ncbi:septum formation family protein [Nocardioides sp. TF02-7]|uniref:septum formation family protein n=1 Tax=Nocardioides sp. TF02-7 TaxID=2917724 RepID=UPI001F0508E8|nr:septum formation family protein [Nocardioides sp. TF02-7]UMG92902.1 septum formation family protein [Nocardioides sp. TF02-7]
MTDLAPARRGRRAARAVVGVLLAVALAGCSGSEEEQPPDPVPTPPPTAAEPPAPPPDGACYRLTFDEALAPAVAGEPVRCNRPHTSETYEVGRLDLLVDGHLVAVDSARAQAQVAETCPAALADFVGGSLADLRLSMVRPVWFTASVEESDRGADWFRCDVVVVAGDGELARLTESLEGALSRSADRDRLAMCGTAAPDDRGFERVVCSARHSWRAIEVVPFPDGDYPGAAAARELGRTQCEEAGLDVADDPPRLRVGLRVAHP